MSAAYPAVLPKPILFHPLKHHLQYQKAYVRSSAHTPEAILKAALRTIGNSQLDLYLGQLPPQRLAQEVITYLQAQECLEPEAYRRFLNGSGADYRTLSLSDGTDWILRWGIEEERHVHLHPARYATHTVRVKANTLKTAMAAAIALLRLGHRQADLRLINQVRGEWLGLSPVKAAPASEGVHELLKLLL